MAKWNSREKNGEIATNAYGYADIIYTDIYIYIYTNIYVYICLHRNNVWVQ